MFGVSLSLIKRLAKRVLDVIGLLDPMVLFLWIATRNTLRLKEQLIVHVIDVDPEINKKYVCLYVCVRVCAGVCFFRCWCGCLSM